jgi:hypothetical protein
MSPDTDQILQRYVTAYRQLYSRSPQDVRVLDKDWVIVNGARMRVTELEYLTMQMQREYQQMHTDRKTLVHRLIKWLTG